MAQPQPNDNSDTTQKNALPEGQEYRVIPHGSVELRQAKDDDGPGTLFGMAAPFDKDSEDLGWFIERIAPGAFTNVLKTSDARALFNHDPNQILGRESAKTLTLSEDKQGLQYEVKLPDTQAGRDIAASVKRGDITGNSFAFTVKVDEWDYAEDGPDHRTIIEIGELFDVGPVAFPAYSDTTVATRSQARAKAEAVCEKQTPKDEDVGSTKLTPLEKIRTQRKTERLVDDVERTYTRLSEAVASGDDDITNNDKE